MPETIKPTPNKKLRHERERRCWSQQELADLLGTTPLNVGRWERGVTLTDPAYRHQGVGTALIHDAIDYASSHHLAQLLLEGIAQFYHRYGYIDVFDWPVQYVDRAAILKRLLTPSLSVR